MRRDPAATLIVAHAFVNQMRHPFDEPRCGEAVLCVAGAPELAVNGGTHAVEDATDETFDERLIALRALLRTLAIFFGLSHRDMYDPVARRFSAQPKPPVKLSGARAATSHVRRAAK